MAQGVGVHRLVGTVILVLVVLCLSPAAHGSPPDPTWIAGFYDNADFDDVVLLITSNLDMVERSLECSLSPRHLVIALLVATDSDTRPLPLGSSGHSRAPPIT
jgi:hypothetical protein